MAFIEPFCTGWEVVTINQLIELKSCLTSEWVNFQRAIIDDIRSGFSSSYCVTSIYHTLKKYTRWFYLSRDIICKSLVDSVKEIADKAIIAKDIANVIEIIWIPFLYERYDALKEISEKLPEAITYTESKQAANFNEDECRKEKALRSLYSVIKGTSLDERRRKSEIMRGVLNGMKGKIVATYLQAAIELDWLAEIPEFSTMKTFWGVEGTQGAISKMFSIAGGSLIHEDTLYNAKIELTSKLAKR